MTDPVGPPNASANSDDVTGAPKQSEDRRFRVAAIVAIVLYAPQVLFHMILPFTVVPTFSAMYSDMGGQMPAATRLVVSLGPMLGVALLALDVAIFWFFLRLARKYWIGLLFAPLFTGGLLLAPIIWALYAPMYQVISLVE